MRVEPCGNLFNWDSVITGRFPVQHLIRDYSYAWLREPLFANFSPVGILVE